MFLSKQCDKLQEENQGLKTEIESKNGIILEQKKLIERTQKLVEDTDKNCRTAINIIGRYERQFKSIKAEAVKEFAARLRYVSKWSQSDAFSDRLVTVRDINDLEEEMVGETDDSSEVS
jgi:DNA polymerase III delta prime subunit